MTVRIGYAKLGRSMGMDPVKYGPQGDAEAPQLLRRLALRNPDVEFYLIGKHGAIPPGTMPPNVITPWDKPTGQAYWHQVGSGRGAYICSHCKTRLWPGFEPDCCDKARLIRGAEREAILLTVGLDGVIMHVGQHGTSNTTVPPSHGYWSANDRTNPQVWAMNYAGYLIEALNAMGDATDGRTPISWVCTDPRNYVKGRDLKWTTGLDDILAQGRWVRDQRHDRYLDKRSPTELGITHKTTLDRHGEVWVAEHTYRHADLELMILPDDWQTWGPRSFEERLPIGVASTSAFVTPDEWRRSWVIRRWVFERFPDAQVFGKWDKKSLEDIAGTPYAVGTNSVAQFPDLLGSWRVTLSLPPSSRSQNGILWSVAKPFQCFAARVVCFMVNPGDAFGWVLPSRLETPGAVQVAEGLWSHRQDWNEEEIALARWLRVADADEFQTRAAAAASDPMTWTWLVDAQRHTLERRWNDQLLERTIEHQLGLTGGT